MKIGLNFRRGDLLALGGVLALAVGVLIFFAPRSSAAGEKRLAVYQDGMPVCEVSLAEDEVFEIGGRYANTVTVQNGRAAMSDSDCPGRDCVHSGWVENVGESIVCLPNRVELRILEGGAADGSVG